MAHGDAGLLADLLGDDPAVRDAAVRRLTPGLSASVRHFLRRYGPAAGGPSEGDLAGEVWAECLAADARVLRAWRGEASLETYLRAVARSVCHRELVRRAASLPDEEVLLRALTASPTPPAAGEAERREAAGRVARALDGFRPGDRLLLLQVMVDEVPLAAAARRLGISVWSAGRRLRRLRGALARILPESGARSDGSPPPRG